MIQRSLTCSFARLDSKLGCIGSKPCSAWLEARLDSAQASDRLRLDSRLGTWLGTRLGTRFGSRPDLGSGTGSALLAEPAWLEALLTSVLDSAWLGFNLRLEVGSGLRLDSKLSPISWARLVSRLSSDDLGTRLCSVWFGSGISRQICNKYVYYIITSNKYVWSDAILPAPERRSYLHWNAKRHMSSALQTESTKLQNENCTIHAKWTPINSDFQNCQD